MSQENFLLNQTQCQILARAIYPDVVSYIEANQEAYQQYMKDLEDDIGKD